MIGCLSDNKGINTVDKRLTCSDMIAHNNPPLGDPDNTKDNRSHIRQRILVVDDDDSIQRLSALALSQSGYIVDAAEKGISHGRHSMQIDTILCRWMPDPKAKDSVPNPFGGRNSVLKVASSPEAVHCVQAEQSLLINAHEKMNGPFLNTTPGTQLEI